MDPSKASAQARDPNTGPAELEMLAGLGLPFLQEYVAVHPNATPALLRKLAPNMLRSENDIALGRAITRNDAAPADVLVGLLDLVTCEHVDGTRREHRPVEELALRVVSHPNTPAHAITRFLNTRDLPRALRVSLAQCVVAVAVLETLTADESPVVSSIASERLHKIAEHRPTAPN